jgi:hypothetical protein
MKLIRLKLVGRRGRLRMRELSVDERNLLSLLEHDRVIIPATELPLIKYCLT